VPREIPLLLVDVDGVLSLFGFAAGAAPPGRLTLIDGNLHLLSDRAAAVLRRLTAHFQPVWCTGWEERAEDHLPHLLGLPGGWPHVPLDTAPRVRTGTSVAGHWKLDPIDAYAGTERPLAWIDDVLDDACVAWAADRAGPTLLVHTDSAIGLTEEHEAELVAWAGM
jgi:hypothetical protein